MITNNKISDDLLKSKIKGLQRFYRDAFVAANKGVNGFILSKDLIDSRNCFNMNLNAFMFDSVRDTFVKRFQKDLQSFFDRDSDNYAIYDLTDKQVNIILDKIKWADDNFLPKTFTNGFR